MQGELPDLDVLQLLPLDATNEGVLGERDLEEGRDQRSIWEEVEDQRSIGKSLVPPLDECDSQKIILFLDSKGVFLVAISPLCVVCCFEFKFSSGPDRSSDLPLSREGSLVYPLERG